MMEKYDCIVLTYDAPHRKTYDTLCLLKASGYGKVLVWAVPMSYKKKFTPLYEHRPKICNNIATEDLCKNFGYEYICSENGYSGLPINPDVPVLICGAGIIPDDVRKKLILINSHPGYIPYARGLDALKWAIYEGKPIGVTTHYIGDEIDAGKVIERRLIPVYTNDTFHALAQRVYENEIEMLVGTLSKINCEPMYIPAGENIVHKRMDAETEHQLLDKFALLVETQGVSQE